MALGDPPGQDLQGLGCGIKDGLGEHGAQQVGDRQVKDDLLQLDFLFRPPGHFIGHLCQHGVDHQHTEHDRGVANDGGHKHSGGAEFRIKRAGIKTGQHIDRPQAVAGKVPVDKTFGDAHFMEYYFPECRQGGQPEPEYAAAGREYRDQERRYHPEDRAGFGEGFDGVGKGSDEAGDREDADDRAQRGAQHHKAELEVQAGQGLLIDRGAGDVVGGKRYSLDIGVFDDAFHRRGQQGRLEGVGKTCRQVDDSEKRDGGGQAFGPDPGKPGTAGQGVDQVYECCKQKYKK